jgi:YggT family protein
MCTTCLLIVFVGAFINVLAGALMLAILVRVILSWVPNVRLPFGIGEFALGVSEPILGPIRRALPMAGGLDFSPFLALIALQWIKGILLGFLAQVG